jgi:hypothetical protein
MEQKKARVSDTTNALNANSLAITADPCTRAVIRDDTPPER